MMNIRQIICGACAFVAIIRREVTSFQPTTTWRLQQFVGVERKVPSDHRMKFCSAAKPPTSSDDAEMSLSEAFERLVALNKEVATGIATLDADIAALKKEMATKTEVQNLKGTFCGVFYPSVLHALLETAVKECLIKYGYQDETRQQKDFHYQCYEFAHCTLRKMLGDRGDFPDRKIRMAGPRAPYTKNQTATGLTKIIYLGIQFLVEELSASHLSDWPLDQNPLMHNSGILDALSGNSNSGPKISKNDHDRIRQNLENKVNSAPPMDLSDRCGGCRDSFEDVASAIRNKGLTVCVSNNEWWKCAVQDAYK